MDYGVYSQNYVGGIINNCGGIARTDAESRFARRICGFNHSGAARCEDYIGLLHKKICHIKRRNIYPAYYALRSTGFNCRFKNDFAASIVDFFALGCGLIIMPFLVLRQTKVLKIAVDVGLVVGITAATTPIGSATFSYQTRCLPLLHRMSLYFYMHCRYILRHSGF